MSSIQFRRGDIELTESFLVADADHVSQVLRRLGAQGIKFSIDDFGTGYSNLGYLQRFAVHRLKIDQSFVYKLAHSPLEDAIVRAVIEMAHCLKLQVVAECVEDAATLQALQGFGCKYGQGYHWSPPARRRLRGIFARAQPIGRLKKRAQCCANFSCGLPVTPIIGKILANPQRMPPMAVHSGISFCFGRAVRDTSPL